MEGGLLGLLGVIITLIFSYFLNKQNKDFQEKSDKSNQVFQRELNNKNLEFQEKLAMKDEDYRLWMSKYNILIKLISYRYELGSNEYKSAMNAIPAVFHDSDEVMEAYEELYDYTELPLANKDELIANDKMLKIYMSIFEHLGIAENVDKTTLLRTFNAPSN